MRLGSRAIALVAVAGILATGCIDESDSSAKDAAVDEHGAPAAGAPATTGAAGSSETGIVESSTVTATLNEWSVTLSAMSAHNGTVSFEVRNEGTEDHAFAVEGAGHELRTEPIKPGESATLSASLAPGEYTVYCPVASGGEAHADRGMKTTFTVN